MLDDCTSQIKGQSLITEQLLFNHYQTWLRACGTKSSSYYYKTAVARMWTKAEDDK